MREREKNTNGKFLFKEWIRVMLERKKTLLYNVHNGISSHQINSSEKFSLQSNRGSGQFNYFLSQYKYFDLRFIPRLKGGDKKSIT